MPAPQTPHTRVEYDLKFSGGDYHDVGQFALVPHSVILANGGFDNVPAAFKAHTGIDPIHIVHYTVDEVFDADGKFMECADAAAPRP